MQYTDSPKRHHYVSRSYLKRWLTQSGPGKPGLHVFNKLRNKHFICTDLNAIAQIRYFNNLEIDIDTYELLLCKYHAIDGYPIKFLKTLEALVLVDQYKKDKHQNFEALSAINKSFLEQEFSNIEAVIGLTLNAAENISEGVAQENFSKELSHQALALTFCTQFFRTKRVRERSINHMQKIYFRRGNGTTELTESQKDNFLKATLLIESNRMVESMVKDGFSASILVSKSDKNFITSNTPAGLKILSATPAKDLKDVEGFMALTPKVALVWSGKGSEITVKNLDLSSVDNINKRIFKFAAEEIYSTHKLP
ncbi:DUF4238 domain-containing protein [Chitinimonas taiwanensis]|uniref:DUF4238 domain-containing protein n=1 Tax=Chitinimonas taiwanensis TaxID=240412 RepID=UPI0035AF23BA